MSGPGGRARRGLKTSLGSPRDMWGAGPNQCNLGRFSCSIRMRPFAPASVSNLGVEKKGMILSLTPASSPPSRPREPVSAIESGPGPQRRKRRHLPLEEDAFWSYVSPERNGGFFSRLMQAQTLSVIPCSAVPRSFGGLLSPPQFGSMTVLLRTAIPPNVHSKEL
ncbi:hypothetical protein GWK47_016382 [Chionoecetes opilio]|uniref:Uncharacterized protein n=1 Tax=Chionoecetes opilio TaxID=41210 RepID=A0A8J5CJN7_CHIOP|nr:hypothetical protein GWK47_016382 [Chionoecetes opilio]